MTRVCLLLVVTGISVALLSCTHKDPDPSDPGAFLTIDVDPNLSGTPEAWVFATDGNGIVLDIKRNTGQKFVLRSDSAIPDTVTVTFFYVQNSNLGSPVYSFHSYGNIPKNSIITARGDTTHYEQFVDAGTADFTVTNTSDLTTFSDGYATWSADNQGNDVHRQVNLYSGHQDFIVSGVKDQTCVYSWFTNVTAGNERSIDISELVPFPKTTAFSFPREAALLGSIKGFKSNNQIFGYQLGNLNYQVWSGVQSMNIGYLDDYLFYETTALAVEHLGGDMISATSYNKRGSPVASVVLPESDFTVTDTTLQNFSYTFTGRIDFKQAIWQYELPNYGIVGWAVDYVGGTMPKIVDFPDTLKAKFPDLDVTRFYFAQANLYRSLDGYTYPEYISNNINFLGAMKDKEYNLFVHN